MPEIRILDDEEALAIAVADHVMDAMRARPRVGILLAGGTTPRRAYERIGQRHGELDVDGVHLWFGDERAVPPDHADSNHGMVARAWLDPWAFPAPQVHRIRGELGGAEAARLASDELRAHAGDQPCFELALLGIGADGHTASLFPGDAALDAQGLFAPARDGARITATLRLLSDAHTVIFVAAGEAKAPAVARAVAGRSREIPASLVSARALNVIWLVDRRAARDLPRGFLTT